MSECGRFTKPWKAQQVASAFSCLVVAVSLLGCAQPQDPPADFQPKTIDPKTAVREADTIVVAYPTSRRDVSGVFAIRRDLEGLPPINVAETETTIQLVQALKGSGLPKELRFRHYDARGYPIFSGPPQGPSGAVGDRGLFFLRRQPDGAFRTAVDIYRPDIPTLWITESSEPVACTDASDCVAKVLLTLRSGDKPGSFAAALRGNALRSQPIVGYLKTFDLLSDLVEESMPREVRVAACAKLSAMYALEFPPPCRPLIAGTAIEREYTGFAAANRESLKRGGVAWLQNRSQFEPKGMAETKRDLELIAKNSDPETSTVAKTLLKSLKTAR